MIFSGRWFTEDYIHNYKQLEKFFYNHLEKIIKKINLYIKKELYENINKCLSYFNQGSKLDCFT